MKFLKKSILFLVALLGLTVFFAPKQQLYYQAEELLQTKNIVLSEEIANDKGFIFNIKGGSLYYDDLEVARLNEITFWPFLVFNRVAAAPFTFSDEMQSFVPGMITQLYLQYSILNPLKVTFYAEGNFGTLSGNVALIERKITLDLIASNELIKSAPFWLRQLKKVEGGVYRYESTY